jgi:hypothetical protein
MMQRQMLIPVVFLGLILIPAGHEAAAATDPAMRCEADKNKTMGKAAKCGAGVVSKAVRKFEAPDADRLQRCADKVTAPPAEPGASGM